MQSGRGSAGKIPSPPPDKLGMHDGSRNRLVYLDSFRGLAIGLVVATHALGYSQLDQENTQLMGFLARTIAVPVFFLVDGILFALGHQSSEGLNYGAYVRKSARRLLLPWTVFTLAYCVLRLGFEYMDNSSTHVVYGQNWRDVFLAGYLSSFSSQMYFLLSLFLIRTASKVTYEVIHARPINQTVTAIVYIIFFHTLPLQSWFFPGLDPIYHALWGMQFYLIGVAIVPWVPVLKVQALWLSAVAVLSGFLIASFVDGMVLYSQFLLLLGCYLFFLSNSSRFTVLSGLGRRSMGIYLLHIPLVMKVFSLALTRLFPPSTFMFFILLTAATLCASALLTSLILQHPYGRTVLGESPNSSPALLSTRGSN
jgi:fucose 4-O-acetylase-like acetyltransferase